jgi:hypothetical protein
LMGVFIWIKSPYVFKISFCGGRGFLMTTPPFFGGLATIHQPPCFTTRM